MEVFKLFGSILVDSSEAEKSLSRTEKKSEGLGSKLGNGMKTAFKWGAAITTAAIGAGGAMFALTNKVTQNADAVAKGATKMGISTDFYQEMDYWAGQNGISQSTMERAIGRLNQRMGSAVNGNEKYSKALEKLGVNMDDVRNGTVSTEDAMTQSIQTLSQMENEQEKSALAAEMFGTKLARDLMPALQDGSLTIEEAKQKAEELGIVMSEDQLKAAEAFQDAQDDVKRALGAVVQQIGLGLMPMFTSMFDWIMQYMPEIQAVFGFVFGVLETFVTGFVDVIGSLISWLQSWFEKNEETLVGIKDTILEYLTIAWEFIQDIWSWISDFWEEHGEMILETSKRIFAAIWSVIEVAFQIITEIIQTALDWAVPFIEKMLAKIFDFWEENGDKIMDAVDNLVAFVVWSWEFIRDKILPIVEYMWNQISTLFETAINVVLGLVDFFASLLTGDFEGAKDALIGIVKSLWDGIKNLFANAWDFVSQPLENLWDKISGWFSDLASSAVDWGKNMISGFIDGIKSMGSAVKDAAKGVMGGIGSFLGFNSPAEEGPGRNIVKWGANMIDGFLDGVDSKLGDVRNSVANVSSNLNPGYYEKTKEHAPNRYNTKNNEITINNTFTTKEQSPSEISRKQKQQMRHLAMEWGI